MRIRYTAIIWTLIAASLLVLSAACGKIDDERIAEEVAREWAMTEAESISEEIGDMAARRYGPRVFVRIIEDETISPTNSAALDKLPPGERVPMSADVGQIQETIEWEFGAPTMMADGRYEVIATATTSFNVGPSKSSDLYSLMLGLPDEITGTYSGSVDFKLDVDTTTREVIAAKMPLISVRIRQLREEGVPHWN